MNMKTRSVNSSIIEQSAPPKKSLREGRLLASRLVIISLAALALCSSGKSLNYAVAQQSHTATAPKTAIKPGNSEQVFIFKQLSESIGQQTVYVGKTGVRTENLGQGITTVASAPDWNVVIYSDEKKAYWECPLKKWKGPPIQKIFYLYGLDVSQFKLQKVRSGAVCGLKASLLLPYTSLAKKEKIKHINLRDSVAVHDQYNAERVREFWAADDIPIAPQGAEILCKSYGLTITNKMPLKLIFLQNNLPKSGLETLACRRSRISPDLFKVPAGYTRAAAESMVVLDLN
jgi:hypothetical protein